MRNDPGKKQAARTTEPQGTKPEEQIRQRAYELYEARGREDGHDIKDWLHAEALIRGIQRKATAA
jgi:hypothetical protein